MVQKLMQNRKGAIPIILAISLLASMITILAYFGYIDPASLLSYDTVYKANWGNICCVAHDTWDYSYSNELSDQSLFKCDVNTDECTVTIYNADTRTYLWRGAYGRYKICDANGNNCGSWTTYGSLSKGASTSFIISEAQSVQFNTGWVTAVNEENTLITIKAKTFYLKGEENGKVYTSEGCSLSSTLKHQVTSDGRNDIPFDQCENYLIDFVSVATKTYSYKGQEVLCQARTLYEVDTQTFKDGTTAKIQGEKITTVECCPSENNCADSFEFEQTSADECTYSTECPNGGDLYGYTQTKAKQYSCVNGVCEEKIVSVECTSTAVCVSKYGEGYVCDFTPNNWGNCKVSSTGTYCGDGYCDIGETADTCPDDCEIECSEGEKLVTIESKVNCKLGFFFCDTSVEKKCVDEGWNWYKLIGIASIVFILLVFHRQLFAIIKSLLAKVGIRV